MHDIDTLRHAIGCAIFAAVTAPRSVAAAAAGTGAVDAQALLTHYKCYICHADREAKAGPAYADVAASLRDRKDAVSVLALTIRRGMRSGGPWHMPPHPEVSAAEARVMARYIMSLRN
jgi:cytochrome c